MNATVAAWGIGLLLGIPLYLAFACFVGRVLKRGALTPSQPTAPAAGAQPADPAGK